MKQATLIRHAYLRSGTAGNLYIADDNGLEHEFSTVERSWMDNRVNVSCIPEGQYLCKRYSSQHFPNTFEITNVINRTVILFHAGNRPQDVKGCICLGSETKDPLWVANSGDAMNEFMRILRNDDEFLLTIKPFRAILGE